MKELAKLTYENEGLIRSIISKYQVYYDFDDLYQAAIVGLIHAYRNFDSSKGAKFSTYAHFYISGEVKRFVRDSCGIKISRDLRKLNLMIDKASALLSQKLLRCPNDSELAAFLEVDEKDIEQARQVNIFMDSLDEENDDTISLYEKVGYQEKAYNEDILDLKKELDDLNPFEKQLINERYFLEKTQQEVSESLGVTQVMVSRKEKDILQRLRARL